MQRRKVPTHVRTYQGGWCKVTLASGAVLIDRFQASRNHGLVLLKRHGRIRTGLIRGFSRHVSPEEKEAYQRMKI